MKSIKILILLLAIYIPFSNAQNAEQLQLINTKAKDPFVKPEVLDRYMIQLRQFENSNSTEQDTTLLETYRTISSSYASNNHFKQSYEVFNHYLTYKEKMLAGLKAAAINHAVTSVSERQQTDDSKQISLQNQLRQLQIDNELLEAKRLSFKGNFSLFLIVLSSIFAIMLVGAGIRMISLRSQLRQSQDRMKKIHSLAVIGSFEPGIRASFRNSFSNIETQLTDLQKDFKKDELTFPPAKQAEQIIKSSQLSVVSCQISGQ